MGEKLTAKDLDDMRWRAYNGDISRDVFEDVIDLCAEVERLSAELEKAERERRKWAGSTDFRR